MRAAVLALSLVFLLLAASVCPHLEDPGHRHNCALCVHAGQAETGTAVMLAAPEAAPGLLLAAPAGAILPRPTLAAGSRGPPC